MTVVATISNIQSIVAQSSGIVSAPTTYPTVLPDTQLPCAITVPGKAVWNTHALGLYRQERTYKVMVFVKPVAQGQGIDEGIQKVFPIMQALGYTVMTNSTLNGTVDHVGTADRTWLRDGGLVELKYAGNSYHGFEIEFEVIEKGT